VDTHDNIVIQPTTGLLTVAGEDVAVVINGVDTLDHLDLEVEAGGDQGVVDGGVSGDSITEKLIDAHRYLLRR
jgi:hypothetical protein